MNNDATQIINGGFDPNRTQAAYPNTSAPTVMGNAVLGNGNPILGNPSMGNGSADGIALTVQPGNRFAHAPSRTRQHLVTKIAVGNALSGSGGGQRMPVNVSLVIDRSGSMEGEPLEYVKRACAYVVDLLTPNDVLSIVTFEETVEVIMPARRVADPNLIKQHIQRILPGNTTNLFDGLYAGGAQAATVAGQGYVSRVLLLTDGEPTAGLRDFQSIVSQVAELKNKGVTVTALGFGPEYNEELMAGIARRSGGNYYYIQRPEQIPDVFKREMETVLGISARNPRLTIELPRGCTVRQVYGGTPNYYENKAEIQLPDLERGATVSKIWEVEWEPHTPGTYRVAKAVLSWDDGNGRGERRTANAVVEFTGDANRVPSGADNSVAQEVAVAQASRDLEKTMMGMRTQQFNVADVTAALNRTQTILTQQGRREEAQQVADATQAVNRGEDGAEKTLIGTIYNLDLGKRK